MEKSIEEIKVAVKKMQDVIFGILCDIDDFCKKNEITYFLSGGTCLGAVRHHDFIPWDDDADIMLPREDYEKFLSLFSENYKEKYGVGSINLLPEWQSQYARIWDLNTKFYSENLDVIEQGIFIDVFPIDGLPDNSSQRKLYFKKIKILCGLQNAGIRTKFLKNEKHKLIKTLAKIMVKPFGPRFFTNKMISAAKRYHFASSEFVGVSLACHYGERETIKRVFMETPKYVEFHGRELPIPSGYDIYLSNLYGDYMKMPKDAEERGYSHLDHWHIEFGKEE